MRILIVMMLLNLAVPAAGQSPVSEGIRNLDFSEQIFPGIDKQISRTDAASAQFRITGDAGREVHITFQLPDHLSGVSGSTLAVHFSSIDAAYHPDETSASTATVFDPHQGVVAMLDEQGSLYLWLGGTVRPLHAQEGAPYGEEIIISATYSIPN